jgi:hypothetical protein
VHLFGAFSNTNRGSQQHSWPTSRVVYMLGGLILPLDGDFIPKLWPLAYSYQIRQNQLVSGPLFSNGWPFFVSMQQRRGWIVLSCPSPPPDLPTKHFHFHLWHFLGLIYISRRLPIVCLDSSVVNVVHMVDLLVWPLGWVFKSGWEHLFFPPSKVMVAFPWFILACKIIGDNTAWLWGAVPFFRDFSQWY